MRSRKRPRGPSSRRRARRLVLCGLALCAALVFWCERGLGSLSPELAEEAARGYVLESIAQAVEGELENGEGLYIQVERDGSGQVTGAVADAAALNRLRAGVLERLAGLLNGKAQVGVPVGSLTGITLLNGRGFRVPVHMQFDGSADLRFDTEFSSAGVNQSLHRVTMTVEARVYSQSRRFAASVEESSATVLAETVVVGPVPPLAVVGK